MNNIRSHRKNTNRTYGELENPHKYIETDSYIDTFFAILASYSILIGIYAFGKGKDDFATFLTMRFFETIG